MKRRILTLALTLLMALGLTVPVLAADTDTPPEISIYWVDPKADYPSWYNRDLNWLSFGDYVMDAKTGKKISDYNAVWPFSDGLALVLKKDANGNEKYGFIDKTGSVVIPLEYDSASDFSDGLAVVRKGDFVSGKSGYIDKTGAVVIPVEYDFAVSFSDGLALVQKDDSSNYEYINTDGSVVLRPETDFLAHNFSDGLALISTRKNGCYYIDKSGSIAISAKEYSSAQDFSEGLAAVCKGDIQAGTDTWGFIDTTGTLVIPCEYKLDPLHSDFTDGLMVVWETDANGRIRCGCIDKTGSLVLPAEYSDIRPLGDGLWRIRDSNYRGGYFVSPYSDWKDADLTSLLKGAKSAGVFPIVPVVGGCIAAVAVIVIAVLMLKKKKPAVETANVPPVQKTQPPRPATLPERPQTTPAARETPPASGPKFCPNCGKPLTPGVKFCPECGHPLQGGEG